MAFDYKKEYKEFYSPKNKPGIVTVPKMNYIAVKGTGNPNEENWEYKNSIAISRKFSSDLFFYLIKNIKNEKF